jgi:flagellar assembly protein FliH
MPLIKSVNVPTSVTPFSLVNIEQQAAAMVARAQQQADQLLAAARTEAARRLLDGKAQGLVEGKRQGMAEGLAEGKKTGHDLALKECREKFTAAITALSRGASELERSRGELESKGLQSVIELSAAIARRVARRQAEFDPQVLIENLRGAMKLVCHWEDVRIAVRHEQMRTLREELPNLQQSWPQLKHVELVEDNKLTSGGCRIFTKGGGVDGDLEGQLDRVIEQILPKGR